MQLKVEKNFNYSLVKLLTSFFGVSFRISLSGFLSVGMDFHLSSLEGIENVLFCRFLILSELLLFAYSYMEQTIFNRNIQTMTDPWSSLHMPVKWYFKYMYFRYGKLGLIEVYSLYVILTIFNTFYMWIIRTILSKLRIRYYSITKPYKVTYQIAIYLTIHTLTKFHDKPSSF